MASQWELSVGLRKVKPGLCNNLEGWDGEEDGTEVQEGGTYVNPWLTYIDVWQKSTHFCKAIILQSKNKNLKKFFEKDLTIISLGYVTKFNHCFIRIYIL